VRERKKTSESESKRARERKRKTQKQRRFEVQTKPKGEQKETTADTVSTGGGCCNKAVKSAEKGMVQQACSSIMRSCVALLNTHTTELITSRVALLIHI
jgi:hypothetical protein